MCKVPKTKLLKAISKELPLHKSNKRIWIATKKLNDTAFADTLTYSYTMSKSKRRLVITTTENDNRKITVRKSNALPIIDICNEETSTLFKDIDRIIVKIYDNEIVIEPQKEEIEQSRARKKLNHKKITFIDLFAGSGTLSEAFKNSGMTPIAATELEEKYLDNYEANNPDTFTYQTNITEIDLDLLPKQATVLLGGIPCECFSPSGVVKKQSLGQKAQEGGDTGSLGYFFLQAVEKIRPALIVIEEVIGFRNSQMMEMIRFVLSARGYQLSEKILKADEYGSMTKRKRFCMVATISKNKFNFSNQRQLNLRNVKDILEVEVDNRVWLDEHNSRSIAYTLQKELKHIEKKEGFRIARTYLEDSVTATITKGYFRNQMTNPILVHPEDSTKFSWFTPRELARLNGLPDSFILPNGKRDKSKCGELIGQGVAQEPFMQVASDIIKHLKG